MYGNRWRSSNPKHQESRRQLVKEIAGRLTVPGGFVFYHLDGDTKWSDRENATNVADFERIMGTLIRQLLQSRDDGAVEERMRKLFLVVPYYSIESWLYQNTEEAIRICHQKYLGKDAERFSDWSVDRGKLDEVHKVKEEVCLSSAHNEELATTRFPAFDVEQAKKSFAAIVETARSSADFPSALASTYVWP